MPANLLIDRPGKALNAMPDQFASLYARKFARAALNIYERERQFSISVEPKELDATVAAFLNLGCSVSTDRDRSTLTVTAP